VWGGFCERQAVCDLSAPGYMAVGTGHGSKEPGCISHRLNGHKGRKGKLGRGGMRGAQVALATCDLAVFART